MKIATLRVCIRPALAGAMAAAAMVLAAAGCAPTPVAPPPSALQQEMNPLGLVEPASPSEVTIIPIPTGQAKGAAHGAGQAVARTLQGCLDVDPTGICVVAALFFSPYLAVGGAIYGLAAVAPESEVSAAQEAIARELAQQRFHERLARRVEALGSTPAARISWIPDGQKRRRQSPLAAEPRLRLELAVVSIKLGRKPAVDPRLKLYMEARARLLRTVDGGEVYRAVFPYVSVEGREFREWGAGGALALHEELQRGYQALAEAIVQTVLLTPEIERYAVERYSKWLHFP